MPRQMRTLLALLLVLIPAAAVAQPVNPWPGDPLTEPPESEPPESEPPESEPPESEPPESEPPPSEPAPRREPPPPKLPPPKPETVMLMRQVAPVKHLTSTPTSLDMRAAAPAPVVYTDPPTPATDVVAAQVTEPEARRYPYELADRPLVLPAGVTELSVQLERYSFVARTRKEYGGGVMEERRSAATPEISIAHAFPRIEVGVGLGVRAAGWIGIDTESVPERVTLSAAFSAPSSDGRYAHSQLVTFTHKLWVEEHHAALLGSAGIEIGEVRTYDDTGATVGGELIAANSGLALRVQAATRCALSFGAALGLPVVATDTLDAHTVASVTASMLIAFESWDLSFGGGIGDATDDMVTQLWAGIAKRWGL